MKKLAETGWFSAMHIASKSSCTPHPDTVYCTRLAGRSAPIKLEISLYAPNNCESMHVGVVRWSSVRITLYRRVMSRNPGTQ